MKMMDWFIASSVYSIATIFVIGHPNGVEGDIAGTLDVLGCVFFGGFVYIGFLISRGRK